MEKTKQAVNMISLKVSNVETKVNSINIKHLCKPRVLSPLRSLRTCVRNEVDLVSLACEDGTLK